jgi:hypothetical protein
MSVFNDMMASMVQDLINTSGNAKQLSSEYDSKFAEAGGTIPVYVFLFPFRLRNC